MTTVQQKGNVAYQVSPLVYGGGSEYPYEYSLSAMEDVYLRGKKDGVRDMEIELMKRGKALFELAIKKASYITEKLVNAANENSITIYDFYLKIENWDSLKSLILVDMNDFVGDNIESLYRVANALSNEINTDDFRWDFSITYLSENLNIDKIKSDGFTLSYEHIPKPRPAQ